MSAADTLDWIAREASICTKCALHESRKKAVTGEGPANAEIMFIGEGPGFHEDEQGRPFVGASGKFLDQLLEQAELVRTDVFIANVVKCRPPGNRDPQPDEMETCTQVYLDLQIALIQPKIIVTLGRFSMGHFLPGAAISRIHGQPHQVGDVIVYPMLHPAAALRRPEWKTAFVADAQRIPELLSAARPDATTTPASMPDAVTQPVPTSPPPPAAPATLPAAPPGDEPQQLSLF